jgi:hypothetical protein
MHAQKSHAPTEGRLPDTVHCEGTSDQSPYVSIPLEANEILQCLIVYV